jgi:hypothetical protein
VSLPSEASRGRQCAEAASTLDFGILAKHVLHSKRFSAAPFRDP